jgi:hypothetical protein
MKPPEDIDYSDHDPLAPMSAEVEAELLGLIHATPSVHPDAEYLRRFQPLDLRACTDR